jgi:hypothetical protein
MTTTTADRFSPFDPAQSFEFKAFLFFERLVATVKVRILVELARLSFLGFFDRFESFLDELQLAEDESTSEQDIRAVLDQKIKLVKNIERLVTSLESMRGVSFKKSNLAIYVAGKERIEMLGNFLKSTALEQGVEEQIEEAKTDFLSTFARRKLTREQRALLIEKYRKLSASN